VPAHRLTQAVLNLLLNSSEAMPGGGTVRLWTRYEQQRRLCVVGVSDDGPGMTARQKRHAFDPFFTSKHRRHATGLGLSLVHGVARSAGGFAEIETELGHGTTVTMHLPVATRIAAVKRRAALVTVDDQRVQACFESLLHASGFNLVTEADAEPLSLLVTDGSEPEATVRSRLQQHPGCRVIVFGDSECVVGDQVRRVTREGGLSAIRDAVTQAMTSGND